MESQDPTAPPLPSLSKAVLVSSSGYKPHCEHNVEKANPSHCGKSFSGVVDTSGQILLEHKMCSSLLRTDFRSQHSRQL